MRKIIRNLMFILIASVTAMVSVIFSMKNSNREAEAEVYVSLYSVSQAPIFYGATEITIDKNVTDNFDINDSRFRIFAKDFEDGDVSYKIECLSNNVVANVAGDYEVKYKVVDSHANKSEITVPVHVLDKEEKECKIIRSLYTLPAMSNLTLAGTERCNNGDRQILGIYLPAGASVSIKPVDAEKNLDITFFTNTKPQNSFTTINSSNAEYQTIQNVASGNSYDSVPLITSVRLSEDNVIDRIYKFELKFNDSAKPLDYYHYKDDEEEFKSNWKVSKNSFGVVDGEAIMCVVPFADVDKLSGYTAHGYGDPFESLDAFFEYYLEVVNRMDKMLGLEFNAKTALDQNYRTKYTAVADSSSSAGAYYAGNYIAVCQSTIAPIFQYGWGTLHEIAHGYQGYLGKGSTKNGSLYLNETGNNILAHYINVDSSLYKKSDRRLGDLETCEEYYNNFRKTTVESGKTIFHNNDGIYTNCNEKLYAIVNLLDSFEGSISYGKLFKYYRKLANEKGAEYYLIADVYAKFFADEYNANILPYLKAWTVEVSEETQSEILTRDIPSFAITSDVAGTRFPDIKTREQLSLNYGLISEEILNKYNLKSNLSVKINIDNKNLVLNKNVAIYRRGELIKVVKIKALNFLLNGLEIGNYELKFPSVLGYDNMVCSVFLKLGDNELSYNYTKLSLADFNTHLTEIRITGIYGTVGYLMSFTNGYTQANITHGGADLGNRNSTWANKPDDTFVSVAVENELGEQIYLIDVKGNKYFSDYAVDNSTIEMKVGYVIKIYSEAPARVGVVSKVTNAVLTEYNTTSKNISYEITADGLKFLNTADFDERQVLYNSSKTKALSILENYRANTADEVLTNKRLDTKNKAEVINAYEFLSEEDRADYCDMITKIKLGSAPVVTQIRDTFEIVQYSMLDLYSIINITDNEDFVVESCSDNVQIVGDFNTRNVGEYLVKYYVTDSDGNVATYEITIVVKTGTILLNFWIMIIVIIISFVGFIIVLKVAKKRENF